MSKRFVIYYLVFLSGIFSSQYSFGAAEEGGEASRRSMSLLQALQLPESSREATVKKVSCLGNALLASGGHISQDDFTLLCSSSFSLLLPLCVRFPMVGSVLDYKGRIFWKEFIKDEHYRGCIPYCMPWPLQSDEDRDLVEAECMKDVRAPQLWGWLLRRALDLKNDEHDDSMLAWIVNVFHRHFTGMGKRRMILEVARDNARLLSDVAASGNEQLAAWAYDPVFIKQLPRQALNSHMAAVAAAMVGPCGRKQIDRHVVAGFARASVSHKNSLSALSKIFCAAVTYRREGQKQWVFEVIQAQYEGNDKVKVRNALLAQNACFLYAIANSGMKKFLLWLCDPVLMHKISEKHVYEVIKKICRYEHARSGAGGDAGAGVGQERGGCFFSLGWDDVRVALGRSCALHKKGPLLLAKLYLYACSTGNDAMCAWVSQLILRHYNGTTKSCMAREVKKDDGRLFTHITQRGDEQLCAWVLDKQFIRGMNEDAYNAYIADKYGHEEISRSMVYGNTEQRATLTSFMETLRSSGTEQDLVRTVLLTGPPGVGKTQLIKELAETYTFKVHEFEKGDTNDAHPGYREARIKQFFAKVRRLAGRNAPQLILLDEVDVTCGKERHSDGSWIESATTVFQEEIEVVRTGKQPILIIGITNRPECIKEPIKSRLQPMIAFAYPDKETRSKIILQRIARSSHMVEVSPEMLERLVKRTQGWSGRSLDALMRDAFAQCACSNTPLSDEVIAQQYFLASQRLVKERAEKGVCLTIAPLFKPDIEDVFSRIRGLPESVRSSLQGAVRALRDPSRYTATGFARPASLLFKGPPGTGKTLAAGLMAEALGCRFIKLTASDVSAKGGQGGAFLQEVFDDALLAGNTIIFIDEVDGIATNHDPYNIRTKLQTLMTSIDKNEKGVAVVCATNNQEKMHEAMGSRRFEVVTFVLPSAEQRADIIAYYFDRCTKLALESKDVVQRYLALETDGCSGADIEKIIAKAAHKAVDRGSDAVEEADFINSVQEYMKMKAEEAHTRS